MARNTTSLRVPPAHAAPHFQNSDVLRNVNLGSKRQSPALPPILSPPFFDGQGEALFFFSELHVGRDKARRWEVFAWLGCSLETERRDEVVQSPFIRRERTLLCGKCRSVLTTVCCASDSLHYGCIVYGNVTIKHRPLLQNVVRPISCTSLMRSTS